MVSTVVETIKGIILVAAGTKARQRRDKAAAAARVAEEAAKEEEKQKDERKKTISFSAEGAAPKTKILTESVLKKKARGAPKVLKHEPIMTVKARIIYKKKKT